MTKTWLIMQQSILEGATSEERYARYMLYVYMLEHAVHNRMFFKLGKRRFQEDTELSWDAIIDAWDWLCNHKAIHPYSLTTLMCAEYQIVPLSDHLVYFVTGLLYTDDGHEYQILRLTEREVIQRRAIIARLDAELQDVIDNAPPELFDPTHPDYEEGEE